MAVISRLFSLLTLSSLVVLICSFQATPAAALSIEVGLNASSPKWSSSSASSQSSDGNNGGGLLLGSSKPGLGWPAINSEQDLVKWKGISTIYTWSPACPSNANDLGMNCCPMLWGLNQVDQFDDVVNSNPPTCVMGMNEPENTGQSNIDAQTGAQLWNQHIRPLKVKFGTTLISPATFSDPAGKQWYIDFFNACGQTNGDKCGVDKLATHWYDVSGDALIVYLEDLHDTFNLPIWLTEFACQNFNNGAQCSQDSIFDFQAQVSAFMESAAFVEHYMPFGAMHEMGNVNELMDSDGGPNALAKAYFDL